MLGDQGNGDQLHIVLVGLFLPAVDTHIGILHKHRGVGHVHIADFLEVLTVQAQQEGYIPCFVGSVLHLGPQRDGLVLQIGLYIQIGDVAGVPDFNEGVLIQTHTGRAVVPTHSRIVITRAGGCVQLIALNGLSAAFAADAVATETEVVIQSDIHGVLTGMYQMGDVKFKCAEETFVGAGNTAVDHHSGLVVRTTAVEINSLAVEVIQVKGSGVNLGGIAQRTAVVGDGDLFLAVENELFQIDPGTVRGNCRGQFPEEGLVLLTHLSQCGIQLFLGGHIRLDGQCSQIVSGQRTGVLYKGNGLRLHQIGGVCHLCLPGKLLKSILLLGSAHKRNPP